MRAAVVKSGLCSESRKFFLVAKLMSMSFSIEAPATTRPTVGKFFYSSRPKYHQSRSVPAPLRIRFDLCAKGVYEQNAAPRGSSHRRSSSRSRQSDAERENGGSLRYNDGRGILGFHGGVVLDVEAQLAKSRWSDWLVMSVLESPFPSDLRRFRTDQDVLANFL